ncbi:MAG: hypothetical protein GXY06_03310 [Clostridiaceae bacterium]|nr:hypothetical protein [Clostridiaceae bacterium]
MRKNTLTIFLVMIIALASTATGCTKETKQLSPYTGETIYLSLSSGESIQMFLCRRQK